MNLSSEQRRAVEAVGHKILVVAGAGSGKTRVLTQRVLWLLEHGHSESSLFVGTYTRKAAGELRHRLSRQDLNLDDLWVGTLHSLLWRMVGMFRRELGYPSLPTLFGQGDRDALAQWVAEEMRLKAVPRGFDVMRRQPIPERAADPSLTAFLAQYDHNLRAWNAIDYDGLIDIGQALASMPACREWIASRFKVVVLDEGQDIPASQWSVLRALFPSQDWYVVASTPQQIQGFAGVRRQDLMAFASKAHVVTLEDSYRCPQPVLDWANAQLLEHNPIEPHCRSEKPGPPVQRYWFPDADSEARWVISEIRSCLEMGVSPRDIAILARTHAICQSFGDALSAENLPMQLVGRHDVFETPTAQLFIALLRVAVNRSDEWSFWRAARLIGIPKGDRPKVVGLMLRTSQPFWNAAAVWTQTRGQGSGFGRLVGIVKELASWLVDVGSAVQAVAGVETLVRGAFPGVALPATERTLLVREIQKIADLCGGLTVDGFLGWLGAKAAVDLYDDQRETVTILTCHAAKGLEWPIVFVVGLEDGGFPLSSTQRHPEEAAEEARLAYVAFTRAKLALCLTGAACRQAFGRTMHRTPSAFLGEASEPTEFGEGDSTVPQDTLPYVPDVPDFERTADDPTFHTYPGLHGR